MMKDEETGVKVVMVMTYLGQTECSSGRRFIQAGLLLCAKGSPLCPCPVIQILEGFVVGQSKAVDSSLHYFAHIAQIHVRPTFAGAFSLSDSLGKYIIVP